MSTLNPNILLAQRPVPTPLQAAAQAAALQGARQRNQLLSQQTAGAQFTNQARRQQLAGQQALIGAINTSMRPDGSLDEQAVYQKVRAVNPQTAERFLQGQMAMKKSYAALDQQQLQNELAKHNAVAMAGLAVLNAPPPQRAAVLQGQIDGLKRSGLFSDSDLATLEAYEQHPNLLQNDPAIRAIVASSKDAASTLGSLTRANTAASKLALQAPGLAAQSQQQVRSAAAQFLSGAKNDADYQKRLNSVAQKYGEEVADFFRSAQPQWQNARTGMSILQLAMTPSQQVSAGQAQASFAERERHDRATEANAARSTIGAGVQMTPEALDMAARMYLQTGVLPSMGFGKAGAAAREKVLNRAAEIDPNANVAGNKINWENRRATLRAFTTGVQGQQINAMNTAIGHLDQLGGAIANLDNGDVRAVNAAKNWLATEFGAAKVTNFNTLKVAVSGELASVLKKSGATDREIEDVQSTIASKNSPAQLAGYIRTQIPILGSKLASLNYQYHQAMGAQDPFSALSPDSKAILQKFGFNPAHPTLTQPGANASGAALHPGQTVTLRNGRTVRVTKVYANGTFDAQ